MVDKSKKALKKEIKSIKATEPELSAHDITIAVSSPVEEGYNSDTVDEDIEKLVAEVENEEAKKAEAKASSEPSNNTEVTGRSHANRALPYRIISRIFAIITSAAILSLIIRVALTNTLPAKFFWPAVAIASLFGIFFLILSFRKKTHLTVLTILNIISIIITVCSIGGFFRVNELMNFLDENLNDKTEYDIYNVFVKNDSPYNSLSDLGGKTLHSISDFTNTEDLKTAVYDQTRATVAYENNVITIMENVLKDNTYIGLLSSGTYDATIDTATNTQDKKNIYEENIKVIGTIKLSVQEDTHEYTSNLTKQSFIMYISGIDTRSDQMVKTSLSDVNIVMAVNPITREILLVSIPRDYYVQLHGTAGLQDKLTHAGSLGGINLSMSTIQDLLDIQFDQYLRVNFNAVVKLVNAIGGITVYSDVDYDITAWTNKSCVFHPGNNQVDGACALAFARERYAYQSGDRHRGENQEQVIEKIFQKISTDRNLINNYTNIMNALSGSFETSLTTDEITSFVKMQLEDMVPWTINSYNLDGTTGSALTYSYPTQYLSVMYPNWATVETAKLKIQDVLSGVQQ